MNSLLVPSDFHTEYTCRTKNHRSKRPQVQIVSFRLTNSTGERERDPIPYMTSQTPTTVCGITGRPQTGDLILPYHVNPHHHQLDLSCFVPIYIGGHRRQWTLRVIYTFVVIYPPSNSQQNSLSLYEVTSSPPPVRRGKFGSLVTLTLCLFNIQTSR